MPTYLIHDRVLFHFGDDEQRLTAAAFTNFSRMSVAFISLTSHVGPLFGSILLRDSCIW